jgi:hypothetical protein
MMYFSPQQRLWLIGPAALLMFWLYSFAVTRDGWVRIAIGVPFMALNCLFNATCGSFIFWELPREWFFTDRLKRHKRELKDGERQKLAYLLCEEMNKADPGHC